MKIKKDKVIMEFSEYIDLLDRHDEDFKENYQLRDILNTYKYEVKILNKKLCDEKRKFYKNRRLFEQFIDEVQDYSKLIQELQCDRVEVLKQIVNKNKEIERLNNIINRAIEYIKAVGVKPKEIDSFVLLDIVKGSDKK